MPATAMKMTVDCAKRSIEKENRANSQCRRLPKIFEIREIKTGLGSGPGKDVRDQPATSSIVLNMAKGAAKFLSWRQGRLIQAARGFPTESSAVSPWVESSI